LLLVVVGVVLKLVVFPSPDGATTATSKSGYMDVIKIDANMSDVLGETPSGSDNAAEHYEKAVEIFQANRNEITASAASLRRGEDQAYASELKNLQEIASHIAQGAKQANMKYLTKFGSGKLQVSKRQDDVERLGQTIDTMIKILGPYLIAKEKFTEASALYHSIFAAGGHMIKARSQYQMTMYGKDIQFDAMNGISKSIPRDTDKDEARKLRAPLRNYIQALNDFRSDYSKKMEIFEKLPFPAGDVWNIAENDKDRVWRVQAILAMGILKFTRQSKANVTRNTALIEKFLNSKDPLEKAAAEAAKAYSKPDFNHAGTTW
jgi:hypothetical protein